MADYICFQKNRIEPECMELKVTAQNSVISASAKIYITAAMLEELQEQIHSFLQEPDLEGYWENDVPGIGGPPCVTLRLLPEEDPRLVLIEIYMELNDGGSFMEHNCRFYVAATREQLSRFSQGIQEFCASEVGAQLTLGA